MITICSLRYLSRLLEKPFALVCNLPVNSTSKCAFFHQSKLLSNNFKIEIKMPSLSPTMTEGTIVKWLKKEGDSIEPGDVLCEIQTDKAIVGLETEEEGVLEKIIVPENTQNVQLGKIIAIILGEGQLADAPIVDSPPQNISQNSTNDLLGPSVKKLLHEFNITCTDVPSSGPKNNLLKGDVLKFIKNRNLKPFKVEQKNKKTVESPKFKETFVDIPISATKMESALQLIQSKMMMPHGYMSTNCKVDNTLNYILKFFKEDVSLNEFIVKSAATSLKRVPKMNSVHHNGQLKSSDTINISMTYFKDGKCVTSFIKDVGSLNVQSISEQIKVLTSSGGGFQISNFSALNISNFVEVISPGNVAILTISGIQSVFEEGSLVKKIRITLSFDNYVVGETEAGEFLETFKNNLENPLILMC